MHELVCPYPIDPDEDDPDCPTHVDPLYYFNFTKSASEHPNSVVIEQALNVIMSKFRVRLLL